MKNLIKVLGIIALVAVIGFSMVGCGGEEEDDNNPGGGETAPIITTTTLSFIVGLEITSSDGLLEYTSSSNVTWSIETGSLPNGLSLSTGGFISGTPTTAGTFNITVKATNATGSSTKDISIVVAPTPEWPAELNDILWGDNAGTYIWFEETAGGYPVFYMTVGLGSTISIYLVSVTGNTIVVQQQNVKRYTFCTSYTITGTTPNRVLRMSGGDDLFSQYMNKDLNEVED